MGAGCEIREGTRSTMDTTIELTTDAIALGALLKLAGVADSGGQAKLLIQDGLVFLNGEQESRRGAKVRPGDVVEVEGAPPARIRVT